MIANGIVFAALFIFWMAGFVAWGKHRTETKEAPDA